jgi:hypothetical protein
MLDVINIHHHHHDHAEDADVAWGMARSRSFRVVSSSPALPRVWSPLGGERASKALSSMVTLSVMSRHT